MKKSKIKNFLEKSSTAVLLSPYAILFSLFIIIPVAVAMGMSFTYYNTIEPPRFIGLKNYTTMLPTDPVFMQFVLPKTVLFGLIAGVGGYILSFFMAWTIAQLPRGPRTVMAVILYSPSLTGGAMMHNIWQVFFNGDMRGWLNYILMQLNIIDGPILWFQDKTAMMPIMILVTIWGSMGVGFLAILAGILNGNMELYEAAYIDGVKNRFQEIIYVTIPSARPQMLFGAVMAIVGTIQASNVGAALSGYNPTPSNAGQLIITHIEDYGFRRFEMGYAAALSVVLLIVMRLVTVGASKIFTDAEGD
jgi:multiple sugar transport system permease protein